MAENIITIIFSVLNDLDIYHDKELQITVSVLTEYIQYLITTDFIDNPLSSFKYYVLSANIIILLYTIII